MEQEITIIPKNSRESVSIRLTEYKGHDLADVRIWVRAGETLKATGKGVSVPIRLLPDLIAGLQEAATIATSAGILK